MERYMYSLTPLVYVLWHERKVNLQGWWNRSALFIIVSMHGKRLSILSRHCMCANVTFVYSLRTFSDHYKSCSAGPGSMQVSREAEWRVSLMCNTDWSYEFLWEFPRLKLCKRMGQSALCFPTVLARSSVGRGSQALFTSSMGTSNRSSQIKQWYAKIYICVYPKVFLLWKSCTLCCYIYRCTTMLNPRQPTQLTQMDLKL